MGRSARPALVLFTFFSAALAAHAAVPLYRSGSDVSLELTVRIQLQYHHVRDDGSSEHDLFFRRLRPALEARLTRAFSAEAELDFADTVEGGAVEFKDLFLVYSGLETRGFLFRFGNEKPAFSRQFQSSSKSLTLVDRGFVGIDDYGTLDRVVGARVEGRNASKRLGMTASLGLASHEPEASRIEFESPLNAGADANLGWVVSGRAELAPLGEVPYDQGDLGAPDLRFALSAAAYRWSGDRSGSATAAKSPERTDLDRSRGFEVGGALRGRGLSADAEWHWIRAEAVDSGFTGGLYDRGEASLTKLSLQSGYLAFRKRIEVVGGFDRLSAATYRTPWKRATVGATVYWKDHRLKLQVNYLLHFGFLGVAGDDPRALTTQLQVLF